MRIELKKFGRVLTSRSSGKEAFAAISPILNSSEDKIEIDFSDIISLTPSWADEFFTALNEFYKGKVVYLHTDNQSVIETFKILEDFGYGPIKIEIKNIK